MKSLLAIATLAAAFSTAAFAADMTDAEIDPVTLTDVTDLTPGEHEISIDLLPNKANGVSGASAVWVPMLEPVPITGCLSPYRKPISRSLVANEADERCQAKQPKGWLDISVTTATASRLLIGML